MFPLALLGAGLGLGKSLLEGLGKKKQAKAQDQAAQANFEARKNAFGAQEGMRAARLNGLNSFLSRYQPSLGAGAPQYGADPETLAKLSAARPFAEAAPAPTSAGMGSALLSGLMGTGSDLAETAVLGKLAHEHTDTVDNGGLQAASGITAPTFHYDPNDYQLPPGGGVLLPKAKGQL